MRKKIRRTGKKKAVAAISLAMLLGMTGCAGKEAAPEKTQENVSAVDGTQEEAEKKAAEKKESDGRVKDEQDADSSDSAADASNEPQEESPKLSLSQGTEHLGGKVQNPQADGMTFAQTTLVDEEGMVTLLDVEDAKKIPVKFTEDTKVEHWTIQGGGAGIDMQNAAVSDLKEGMGVELEGYFDGDTFVAAKVIIEDYV
ncbi:MAG: hypothetical protein K2O59_17100 [Lachnospiraceae bacterium]|nr:hypothetical protein [Lachnospiraceae bacterium]